MAVLLAACAAPPSYHPPPQKVLPQGPEPLRERPLLHMSDPDLDYFIGGGMFPFSQGSWRWTHRNPEFRIYLADPRRRELRMRFAVIDSTFRRTGPVTVTPSVNHTPLAPRRYEGPGEYEYRCPVPGSSLKEHAPAIVGLGITPVFVGERDGTVLGVYLRSIGLPREGAP